MFFRTPRFIRRWFRRKMHPMTEHQAWTVKERVSVLYMFFAWNAFGFVIWNLYNGNKYWPVKYGVKTKDEIEMSRPGIEWARTLGMQKAEIYKFGSGGLSDKVIYNATPDEGNSTK